MATITDSEALAWAQRLSSALDQWMNDNGYSRQSFAQDLHIKPEHFGRIYRGDGIIEKADPTVYARIFDRTGLPEADPRHMASRRVIARGVPYDMPRAWSEEQWQQWLLGKSADKPVSDQIESDSYGSKTSTETRPHRPKVDMAIEVPAPDSELHGHIGSLSHRPKVTEVPIAQPQEEFYSPVSKSRRVDRTPPTIDAQALANALVQVIQVATWPLTERLIAIEQQLQQGDEPVPQSIPKPATQLAPAIKSRDPSVVISELISILRPIIGGSVEDRDRFAEEYQHELIELVSMADPLTRPKEVRERQLAANMEVRIQ